MTFGSNLAFARARLSASQSVSGLSQSTQTRPVHYIPSELVVLNPDLDALRRVDRELAFSAPPVEGPHPYDVQLSHLFDMIPASVMLKDSHGNIVKANKQAELMLALYEITGRNAREIFRDHERRDMLDAQVIQTGIPKRGELHEHLRPDGTRIWMLEDRIPHHDKTGSVDGVLVFAVDVSIIVADRR